MIPLKSFWPGAGSPVLHPDYRLSGHDFPGL
jgi:hypothetical protein